MEPIISLQAIRECITTHFGFHDEHKIIEFRHWMHQNAEGHLKEYNTQAKIKETLISLGGFKDDEVKSISGTGLIIDIHGEGP
jgi:metal-dependent amidase/aminoacylase/carboxypeptidase family protein